MELDITNTSLNVEVAVTGENPLSLDVTVPQGADGIVFTLDKPTMGIAALPDGSSPVLTDAAISASIMRGIHNDTTNWTIGATPVGCTGSLADHTTYVTFTVATMTSDTATVTFAATRSGFSSLSKVATLTKLKQPTIAAGIEAGTETATPADTDVLPSVSAAHAAQKSTWAQIKAAIYLKLYDWLIALTAKTTLADGDSLWIADAAGAASKKIAASLLMRRTKMPDGATAVDSNDAWPDTTGWSAGAGATLSVAATAGALRVTATATSSAYARKSLSGHQGKIITYRYRTSPTATGMRVAGQTTSEPIDTAPASVNWAVRTAVIPLSINNYLSFYPGLSSYASDDWIEVDFYSIGDYSYLPGSGSEEAARIANQRGDMPGVGVYASQTITATDLATAGKSDTIGGKKYTFVAALTPSPGVEGEILKESTKEAELENENLAISEVSRANNGVKYWAAAVHPLVSSSRVNAVLTLTAKTNNGPENGITVVCESGTNHTAGGATLAGGYTDSAAKTIAEVQNNIAGSGTRPAAAKMELTNTALIGYETTVDVAAGGTLTLPAGGTWYWNVYGYGATISSAKRGSSAGGTTLTVAGANASVGYRRVA